MSLLSAMTAVLLSILASGCIASVRMPDAEETDSIRRSQKAIVFMRLETRFENEPVRQFDLDAGNVYMLKSATFEEGRKLNFIWPYRSPSQEALDDGWVYFLLEPGSHYIYAKQPPHSHYVDNLRKYTPFWLMVPKGSRLVYAGSFSSACRSKRLIFSNVVEDCSDLRIIDESSRARAAAGRSFPEYGSAITSLAQEYPLSGVMQTNADLLPLEVIAHDLQRLDFPDWQKRGISRATGIGGEPSEEPELPPLSGFGGDPRFGAAVVMLYIMYLPIGLTTGAITGALNEDRWAECIQDLEAGSRQISMDRFLRQQFEKATASGEPDRVSHQGAVNRPRSRLDLAVHRLAIRECSERNTFCPEIALRATLTRTDGKDSLYDAVFAYANKQVEPETPAIQIRPGKGSACRELADYCSEKGKQDFYDELLYGLRVISERIIKDLGFSPSDRAAP